MALQRKSFKRAITPTAQVASFPAPSGGMDGRAQLSRPNPDLAVYTYNLMSDEIGMKVRKGYREWAIDLETTDGLGVRTLIPYDPSTVDPSEQRLFAATNEGIWDVTTLDTPVSKIAFNNVSGRAGVGVFQHYVTDAGDDLLFYADTENGLFTYTRDTDTWAQTTGITGIDAENIVFVVVHKQRIWFALRNSSDAYYLDVGAIAGAATLFQFGNKFKRGGILQGLFSWTIDGGSGIDDYLVGVSSAGDVLPYQGADPEAIGADEWQLRGVYYVGQIVGGVRCASEFGGDLHILSVQGITPLSQLLQGIGAPLSTEGIGAKTAYYLREDIKLYAGELGWGISYFPSISSMVLSTPVRNNGQFLQYVYDIPKNSFGWWRDIPMRCCVEWKGTPYIGTSDNRVLIMDAELDNVKITPPVGVMQNGEAIKFSSLFFFGDYESGGMFKRGVSVRPDFMSSDALSYRVKFSYDYNRTELADTTSLSFEGASRWDNALWDNAVWTSNAQTNRQTLVGGSGMGRRLAIAVQGSAQADTFLQSYDVMWNTGGMR